MDYEEQIRKLINKWLLDIDGFRTEARRLEQSDRSRHESEIAMLETRAQAVDRCVVELEKLNKRK